MLTLMGTGLYDDSDNREGAVCGYRCGQPGWGCSPAVGKHRERGRGREGKDRARPAYWL